MCIFLRVPETFIMVKFNPVFYEVIKYNFNFITI
jgi:hypothetical protein